jgi:hypothetical protein
MVDQLVHEKIMENKIPVGGDFVSCGTITRVLFSPTLI